jgi:hypothetical protein
MGPNLQSTKHTKWTIRMWRTLAAWEEAISASPREHLEKAQSQRWNRKLGPVSQKQ